MTAPDPVELTEAGAAVSVAELTKVYRAAGGESAAVDGLSLDLVPSSVTAVTGPSGSGKSTLLRLVGGLARPDGGLIVVDGERITSLPSRRLPGYRRRLGLVFERGRLLPALTVLGNLLTVPGADPAVALDLLAVVGLTDRAADRADVLAPYDRQRVAVARALVGRPSLVLLDEPTGGLSADCGEELMALLLRLRDEYGATMLIATHDPEVAIHCDRVIRLRDGRVVDDSGGLA